MTDFGEPEPVRYAVGDATCPEGGGLKIIAHCCNNIGAWGAGFVLALSRKWRRPEQEYRRWAQQRGETNFRRLLGVVQLVPVEADIAVANIIGQEGIGRAPNGDAPIRYEALSKGFGHLSRHMREHPELGASVHMPRIGCGLAGGDWARIAPLLEEHFAAHGLSVTVYDLPAHHP